jgi:hypothetical protein
LPQVSCYPSLQHNDEMLELLELVELALLFLS